MLPHFVAQDLKEVTEALNGAGYAFQADWFAPFLEFRFPHYGTVRIRDMEMEIRMGIEPWHVLGEEVTGTATARYVDSSLERLEIKLTGFNGARYVLLCNGNRVPLRETPVKGEYVCGIRYRAWQPYSALHPTIGIDAPLAFDIVDTWNSRSIGGCTYYVSHPGGRGYEVFPVNSYEAESRRGSRFGITSHTQDLLPSRTYFKGLQRYIEQNREPFFFDAPPVQVNREYPCTLDMRQFWVGAKGFREK
jgi:uncharacterized protein (DUF2126 family)